MADFTGYGDRYIRTFLCFWRLSPRRFVGAMEDSGTKRDPGRRHLGPWRYYVVSASALFAINVALLSFGEVREFAAELLSHGEPHGFAAFFAALSVVTLGLSTLFYFAVSRLWPVRANVGMRRIFEFRCYMVSAELPLAALSLLMAPWWSRFFAAGDGFVPVEISGPAMVIGYSYLVLVWLFRACPYYAALCGISTARAVAATALWFTVFGALVTVLAAAALVAAGVRVE